MTRRDLIESALDKLALYVKNYSELDLSHIREMIKTIPVAVYKKNDLLIEQGNPITKCFFVIEGCARQFSIDEEGKEVTSDFFVENQSIVLFGSDQEGLSPFSVECLEACVLIVGDLSQEEAHYEDAPELLEITRKMIEESMGKMQQTHANFIRLSSEERVKQMLEDESDLFNRVAKYQVASYLGITPESLSRILRRLNLSHLKIVD